MSIRRLALALVLLAPAAASASEAVFSAGAPSCDLPAGADDCAAAFLATATALGCTDEDLCDVRVTGAADGRGTRAGDRDLRLAFGVVSSPAPAPPLFLVEVCTARSLAASAPGSLACSGESGTLAVAMEPGACARLVVQARYVTTLLPRNAIVNVVHGLETATAVAEAPFCNAGDGTATIG
ncbi:MAG TPA: hypothetical protein VI997_08590 [Candidatus Thermoplasmatota archaeon]|nr:hypothetical protein [Candidatus Thermoplasmatota archaeon]